MATRRSIATHKQVMATTAFLVKNANDLSEASATRIARRLLDEEGVTIEPQKVRDIAEQLGVSIRPKQRKQTVTVAFLKSQMIRIAAELATFMEAVGYDVPDAVKELRDERW